MAFAALVVNLRVGKGRTAIFVSENWRVLVSDSISVLIWQPIGATASTMRNFESLPDEDVMNVLITQTYVVDLCRCW